MRDDELSTLLSEDFETLALGFETDSFSRKLQNRVVARKRARTGILGIVGIFGAGVAASQFNQLLESVTHSALLESALAQSSGNTSAIAASLIIATAVIATAIVLQREG